MNDTRVCTSQAKVILYIAYCVLGDCIGNLFICSSLHLFLEAQD